MKRRAVIMLSFMTILTVVASMATRMAWATVLPKIGPMASTMAMIDDR